jgi:hypothetical protein
LSTRHRSVAWVKEEPYGVEFADVTISPETMAASGVAVGVDPGPYRLDYTLETADEFVTSRLVVTAVGEGIRSELDLRRSGSGQWSANVELPDLREALDCDLGLSPLTNSMPVLRRGLLEGDGSFDFLMAWVSVPDLTVQASPQRYTALGDGVVRYESRDGDFVSELTFDDDGLVVDYPQLARRLRSPSGE